MLLVDASHDDGRTLLGVNDKVSTIVFVAKLDSLILQSQPPTSATQATPVLTKVR